MGESERKKLFEWLEYWKMLSCSYFHEFFILSEPLVLSVMKVPQKQSEDSSLRWNDNILLK
jgi:hypothetical protein